MKTCIKMANGNVYVVDYDIETVVAKLSLDEPYIKLEGTDGRDDFFINPLQVCAVYPARPE